jgi:hypothetical protein
VTSTVLWSELVKVNTAPVITNRAEVEAALGDKYGWMLS